MHRSTPTQTFPWWQSPNRTYTGALVAALWCSGREGAESCYKTPVRHSWKLQRLKLIPGGGEEREFVIGFAT